jgi:(p)ppGpp synthase/HD superfamily hydrolase
MYTYAQTNVQLFKQLRRDGYLKDGLIVIRNAYELAMRLFTGFFLASGRTQVAHVVGTASILGFIHLPAEVLAAGLIHNAYETGDFGDGRKGVSEARRKQVIYAVGKGVEEYVYRFPALRWNSQTIPVIRDRLNALDPIDRNVLLIRLADQLEHYLDLGGFYYHCGVEEYRKFIDTNCPIMVDMAERMGFPALAAELERVFKETVSDEIAAELFNEISRSRPIVIPPKSYRKRFSVVFYQELVRGPYYLRRKLHQKLHRLGLAFGMRKN